MRDFRTLNIWKGVVAIVKQVYLLAELLPVEEKYGLRSQICRVSPLAVEGDRGGAGPMLSPTL